MISTKQFRSGIYIRIKGELYMIIESQHYKPGKGGAIIRTKLKNLRQNSIANRTFRAGETVENIFVEEKKYQYLYCAEGLYHFMDNVTYEQISLPEEKIGDNKKFLKENAEVTVSMHEGNVLNIKLPNFINLEVAQTEPGIKGDTVKAGGKSAKLETGATIQVPLFINIGNVVTVDTRTGKYVGRA